MGLESVSYLGTVFAAPVDSEGVQTAGFMDIGEVYPLEFQASTTPIKVKSRKVETPNQTLYTKIELEDTEGSMTLHQINARNLAWVLSGNYVELTGEAGAVDAGSPEEITALAAGQGSRLANRDVSAVVVKDSTDTTTYVLNTDYTLHAKLGIITPTEGGDITTGDTLNVSYSYAAQTGYRVNIGTETTIRVALYGLLENEFTGSQQFIEFDKLVLSSSAPINFISEAGSEGEEYQFSIVAETVSGKTSPGRVDGVSM